MKGKLKVILSLLLIANNVFAIELYDQKFLNDGDFEKSENATNIPREIDNYTFSPLSQYLNKQQYENFKNEVVVSKKDGSQYIDLGNTLRAGTQSGHLLTIDTRNEEACSKIQYKLQQNFPKNDYHSLCEHNDDKPFSSVIIIQGLAKEERVTASELLHFEDERYNKLAKQTRNLAGLGLMTFGLLAALPEDITQWNKDELNDLGSKWRKNVKEGPVRDKDKWYINYIGHPIAGAQYHLIARHAGLPAWESFGYSVFMSTFFWEYGLEAFAEVPSIQDLLITPIVGSLLGEMFYRAQRHIDENDGKLFNSKKLGNFAKGAMYPAKPFVNWINRKVFESKFIKNGRTYFYTRSPLDSTDSETTTNSMVDPGSHNLDKTYFGIGIEFKFQ